MITFKEYYEQIDNEDQRKLEKLIIAGTTQRDIPETAMYVGVKNIQNASGPNILCELLEHIGDISERASKQNSIGNVVEKVKKGLKYINSQDGYPLKEEIEEQFNNTAIFKALEEVGFNDKFWEMAKHADKSRFDKRDEEIKNLTPRITEIVKNAKIITKSELSKYVKAHKEHNKPITTLGRLGKKAAIELGNLNYSELFSTLKKIEKWVQDYNNMPYPKKIEKLLQGYDETRHDYIEGEENSKQEDIKI